MEERMTRSTFYFKFAVAALWVNCKVENLEIEIQDRRGCSIENYTCKREVI